MIAKNILINILCLVFCFPVSVVFGCLYTVRDVGFVDINPEPYELCYYIQDNTSQDAVNTFRQISYIALANSNIKVRIINIDEKTDEQDAAIRYVELLGIKSFPTAILMSPKGQLLVLPDFPQDSSKESIWSALDNIVKSPTRDEIQKHIVKSHSVVLLILGKNAVEANEKANAVVTESIKEIGKTMSQMPKSIEEPPHLITITPEMFSKEKILLWSLGLNENEINKPYAAILYGKCRQIGNVLESEKIAISTVYNTLALIGASCECELDKRWLYGNMIPIRWEKKKQLEAIKSLGFDPENPMVKTEISQILATGTSSDIDGTSQSPEYSESIVEYDKKSNTLSPAQIRRLTSSDSASKEEAKTDIIEIKNEEARKKELSNKAREELTITKHEERTISNKKAESSFESNSRSVAMASVNQKKASDQVNNGSLHSAYFNTLIVLGAMFLLIVAGGVFVFLRTRKRI